MRLAFTIICHKHPRQVIALAKAVANDGHYCLIHCNVLSGPEFRAEIEAGLRRHSLDTARLIESEPIAWGTSSIMRVQLRAIREMLAWRSDWSHLINLSGQCLPTKPVAQVAAFLAGNPGKSFLECMDFVRERPELNYRISRYHVEIGDRTHNTYIPRPSPRGLRVYFGTFWAMLSHAACERVISSDEARRVLRFVRFTTYPEEFLFQSILLNSELADTVVRDPFRLILWEGKSAHPVVLTTTNWDRIVEPGHFFARKFDPDIDAEVMLKLGALTQCDYEEMLV